MPTPPVECRRGEEEGRFWNVVDNIGWAVVGILGLVLFLEVLVF